MKYLSLFILLFSSLAHASVDLVKVDKSENRMMLYAQNVLIKSYHIALGGAPQGHKAQEGDQKTPEGTYTLDYKKDDSSFYRAMHVSYPNAVDVERAKARDVPPGGFIMVHGQRNGFGWLAPITQQFNWTNGCIALTNDEMDEFMSLVSVGTTIQIEW